MTWGVSWAVDHVKDVITHLHCIAVTEPMCGGECFGMAKTKTLGLIVQTIQPKLVTNVWADDGYTVQSCGQFGCRSRMIKMAVGQ